MKVLSLFDGMACGMLAMQKAGIPVDRYVAYEIDKYAVKASSHNFPMIEQRGDVFEADFNEFDGFDYLIGGSPCTYWSIAQKNNRETVASGMGWELFSQYVRALHEAKPRFFVYENNKSMSNAIRESITHTFGFDPVCINSALVSAQNRQRLYWVGKREADGSYSKVDVDQPEDLGILLKDVLEVLDKEAVAQKDNQFCEPVCMRYERNATAKALRKQYEAGEVKHGFHEHHELHPRLDGKTNTLSTVLKDNPICEPVLCGCGMGGGTGLHAIPVEFFGEIPTKAVSCADRKEYPVYEVKDGLISIKEKRYPIKLKDGFYIIRNLTVLECMRLQTVPEWYEFPVSNTQSYRMLGNGWTIDVISHILCAIKGDINENRD